MSVPAHMLLLLLRLLLMLLMQEQLLLVPAGSLSHTRLVGRSCASIASLVSVYGCALSMS